jgi:hypothetical protein
MASQTVVNATYGIVHSRQREVFRKPKTKNVSGRGGNVPRPDFCSTVREMTMRTIPNPAREMVSLYRSWQDDPRRSTSDMIRAKLCGIGSAMVQSGLEMMRPTEKLDLDGLTITMRALHKAAQPPKSITSITVYGKTE